ncbi:DUF3037 domain-containing protein [Neptunomonas phycophila]|uniref:DUF3037 domain-containing protein n=3 Tax=Neptunomonas phycophila TaxID=1572645 RepID=UPI00355A2E10
MVTMKQFGCKYWIIRFAPYSETQEFANIGICLYSPKSKELHFKLANKRFGRVTSFFENLNPDVYKAVIDVLSSELSRLQEYVKCSDDLNLNNRVVEELLRPKNTLLQFSDERVLLTENPLVTTKDLFSQYVAREFTKNPSREKEMVQSLRNTLKSFDLAAVFKEKTLADEFHEAKFPLVRDVAGVTEGAIRAIAFDQKSKLKVVESADLWEARLESLTKSGVVDADKILITIAYPNLPDKKARLYIDKFSHNLALLGIHDAVINDEAAIERFVSNQANTDKLTLSN